MSRELTRDTPACSVTRGQKCAGAKGAPAPEPPAAPKSSEFQESGRPGTVPGIPLILGTVQSTQKDSLETLPGCPRCHKTVPNGRDGEPSGLMFFIKFLDQSIRINNLLRSDPCPC